MHIDQELDRLRQARGERIEALRANCVCRSATMYSTCCWGCGQCWSCVDRASQHHCIECCENRLQAAKATWETRTWPSVKALLERDNGSYSALVLLCHQAEVLYRAIHQLDPNKQCMREAIRFALHRGEPATDSSRDDRLPELIRLILNQIKHEGNVAVEMNSGDCASDVEEITVIPSVHYGFYSVIEAASIVDGKQQPPTERYHRIGLYSVVEQLCLGLDSLLSDDQDATSTE